MEKCPLRVPADLANHTLLHAATLRTAWPRWLAAANAPELKPAREQVFEHFYFAIQAALEGLGIATRNDARCDAQSSAIFNANYVRLEGATNARCLRLNARLVRPTRNHPGSAHAT